MANTVKTNWIPNIFQDGNPANCIVSLIDSDGITRTNIFKLDYYTTFTLRPVDVLKLPQQLINNSEYNNFHKANNITNIKTKIKINIMPGINYAYPYENQTENTQNLNNINKNLNLLKYKNILINKNIAESIKLDYANKYLLINETKYNYNIKNGGLYNDWNFTF